MESDATGEKETSSQFSDHLVIPQKQNKYKPRFTKVYSHCLMSWPKTLINLFFHQSKRSFVRGIGGVGTEWIQKKMRASRKKWLLHFLSSGEGRPMLTKSSRGLLRYAFTAIINLTSPKWYKTTTTEIVVDKNLFKDPTILKLSAINLSISFDLCDIRYNTWS